MVLHGVHRTDDINTTTWNPNVKLAGRLVRSRQSISDLFRIYFESADALDRRGAPGRTSGMEVERGPAVELTAPRVIAERVPVGAVVLRGLVGEVERRGGGRALVLGQDEGACQSFRVCRTAGASVDHVVAAGIVDLKVTGRR